MASYWIKGMEHLCGDVNELEMCYTLSRQRSYL